METRTFARAFFTAAALALFAVPAPASAYDCSDDVSNLLNDSNCGFDSNLTGWILNLPQDSFVHVPGDGDPELGCGEIDLLTNPWRLSSACVPVTGSETYDYGARFRQETPSTVFCSVELHRFSDAACTTSIVSNGSGSFTPSATWTNRSHSSTVESGAQSARLVLVCSSFGSPVVRFDNGYIGQGISAPVELPSFSV